MSPVNLANSSILFSPAILSVVHFFGDPKKGRQCSQEHCAPQPKRRLRLPRVRCDRQIDASICGSPFRRSEKVDEREVAEAGNSQTAPTAVGCFLRTKQPIQYQDSKSETHNPKPNTGNWKLKTGNGQVVN